MAIPSALIQSVHRIALRAPDDWSDAYQGNKVDDVTTLTKALTLWSHR
jgi:hypothetical protein